MNSKKYLYGMPFFRNNYAVHCPNNNETILLQHNQTDKLREEIKPLIWDDFSKCSLMTAILKYAVTACKMYCSDAEVNAVEYSHLPHIIRCIELNQNHKFDLNWYEIVHSEGLFKHTVYECKGLWAVELNTNLSQDKWSKEEKELLKKAVIEHKKQDWDNIAGTLSNRSAFQCFQQYQSDKNRRFSVERWSKYQDKVLFQYVEACTIGEFISWNDVSLFYDDKMKNQLYDRYIKLLRKKEDELVLKCMKYHDGNRSAIKKKNRPTGERKKYVRWTKEQDNILLMNVDKHGHNWLKISQDMEDKNRLQCKQRYRILAKRRFKE